MCITNPQTKDNRLVIQTLETPLKVVKLVRISSFGGYRSYYSPINRTDASDYFHTEKEQGCVISYHLGEEAFSPFDTTPGIGAYFNIGAFYSDQDENFPPFSWHGDPAVLECTIPAGTSVVFSRDNRSLSTERIKPTADITEKAKKFFD